jgi:hypothetical protein
MTRSVPLFLFLLPLLVSSIFLHKDVDPQQQFCLQDDIRTSSISQLGILSFEST